MFTATMRSAAMSRSDKGLWIVAHPPKATLNAQSSPRTQRSTTTPPELPPRLKCIRTTPSDTVRQCSSYTLAAGAPLHATGVLPHSRCWQSRAGHEIAQNDTARLLHSALLVGTRQPVSESGQRQGISCC